MLINGADGGLRAARPEDVQTIQAIHNASVYGLCSGYYLPDQQKSWTAAFAAAISGVFEEDGVRLIVAEHQGVLAGFGLLKDNCICAVYVRPEFAGLGLGRELVLSLEARVDSGRYDRICLSASLNAVGFYERLGYICDGGGEMQLPDGNHLQCTDMHKDLA